MLRSLQKLFRGNVAILYGSQKYAMSNTRTLPMFYSIRVENDIEKKVLNVTWDDEKTDSYPHIFLRDNCQCPDCFHPTALQRMVTDSSVTQAYDVSVTAVSARLISGDHQIQVGWKDDDHVSVFDVNWLKARQFTKSTESVGEKLRFGKKHIWGGELTDKIPTSDFQRVMREDLALHHWLRDLATTGLTVLKNVPLEVGQVKRLADRVAYIRPTNYGYIFTVKAKIDPSNLAFTSHGLALHTDQPYFNIVPGIQMLHCIEQAPGGGGENQFVDGFYVAELMRKNHRDLFDLLTKYPFVYADIGKDYVPYNHLSYHPIIKLNDEGEVIRVVFNNHARSSLMDVPEDKVVDVYRAFHRIVQTMYDPTNFVCKKMDPGDLIVFDNWRVLHGRSPFTMDSGTSRHLEGTFIDWDEAASRMRVIEDKLRLKSFTGII